MIDPYAPSHGMVDPYAQMAQPAASRSSTPPPATVRPPPPGMPPPPGSARRLLVPCRRRRFQRHRRRPHSPAGSPRSPACVPFLPTATGAGPPAGDDAVRAPAPGDGAGRPRPYHRLFGQRNVRSRAFARRTAPTSHRPGRRDAPDLRCSSPSMPTNSQREHAVHWAVLGILLDHRLEAPPGPRDCLVRGARELEGPHGRRLAEHSFGR